MIYAKPVVAIGKGRVFAKFLLSYFFILVIPLSIGLYAYERTIEVLREDAVTLNAAVLQQSEQNMNQLLLEIRDVVSLVSLNTDMLMLMSNAGPEWSADTIYRFSQLKNELSKLSTNKYFSDVFVYMRKSGSVVSKDYVERAAEHPMRIGAEPVGLWLERTLREGDVNRYARLENVAGLRDGGNYIAYVGALPPGYSSRIDGAVVILMEEKTVASMFSRLLVQPGSFAYIVDEENRLIASASRGTGPVRPVAFEAEDRARYQFLKMNGQNMFVSNTRSATNGWTYAAGVPAETVLSKADYIKRINLVVLLLAGSAGCVIALLFAYRNSKPIVELLESIKDFGARDKERRRKPNEMEMLKSAVSQMKSSHQRLNVRMNRQLPLLQEAFFERLLKSGFNSRDELNARLAGSELELREGTALAVAVKLRGGEFSADERADSVAPLPETKRKARAALEEALEGGTYVHDPGGETLALIVTAGSEGREAFLRGWEERLRNVQERLLHECEAPTSIGVGRTYAGPMDLWRSWNEACQALDYQEPGLPQQLTRYDSFSRNSNHYYYPLDLETKLIHTVRSGDTEALARLFEHFEHQNFQLRRLSPIRKKQLLQEMRGTLEKLSEQIRFRSGLEPIAAEPDGVAGETGGREDAFAQLKQTFFRLCEHLENQKNERYRETFERMKAYIAARCNDSNLSLSELAGEFKQSESYVSTFFKEQMGATFSDYLERLRLEQACGLLRDSELAIREIAVRVGYGSDKSFRRAFKRAFGTQPTAFRKAQEARLEG